MRLEHDDAELTVKTGVAHVTARLLGTHGAAFGAEMERARHVPTAQESWSGPVDNACHVVLRSLHPRFMCPMTN